MDCYKISEKNIKEINTSALRSIESLVSQETILFNNIIEENILIANRKATRDDVIEACKKALFMTLLLNYLEGYDTNVGEFGSTLSGGERQRIGLGELFYITHFSYF